MGELRGHKVAKRPIMRGRFQFSGLTMLKRRDITVGSGMFAQVWRRVYRPGNRLNKKLLSPASLSLTMKAKLLETMKEIPLLILKQIWACGLRSRTRTARHLFCDTTNNTVTPVLSPANTDLHHSWTKQRWYTSLELICHLLQGVTAENTKCAENIFWSTQHVLQVTGSHIAGCKHLSTPTC